MTDEVIAPTIEELQAQLAESNAERDKLRAHSETLLSETKAAKDAKKAAEMAAQAEREKIAKESNDFEQLHKSSDEQYQNTLKQLEELQGSIAVEKRNNAAMKVATELADGANAELLSEFISRRLKYTESGVKVTNQAGELTVSTLADLATEFKNDVRYSALLKGNQSSGGGASGGSNSGGAAKTMTRSSFNELSSKNPIAASKFMKDGGTLTQD